MTTSSPEAGTRWQLRLARESDADALAALIPLSARSLQRAWYSLEQIQSALGPVFGVDRQLIQDGTYFVADHSGLIIGCGGWSRRRSRYGGDAGRAGEDPLLDPHQDAARIRAFFIHPGWARQGIGRSLLVACERAIQAAGFRTVEIVATLAGEPLYAACGYRTVERYDIPLTPELNLPVVKMIRNHPLP